MSVYDPTAEYDPYATDPSFQIPGKTPANQQSFIAAMTKILGHSPITDGGQTAPEYTGGSQYVAPQMPEPINPYAETYGNSPLYATIFDQMGKGLNPMEAVDKGYELNNKQPTSEEKTAAIDIAQKYAMTDIENENSRMKFEQQNAYDKAQFDQGENTKYADWQTKNADALSNFTFHDQNGNPYANSVKGGVGYDGTASEYELMGMDQMDPNKLIDAYAKTVKPVEPLQAKVSLNDAFHTTRQGNTQGSKGRGAAPRGVDQPVAKKAPGSGGRFSDNVEVNKYAEEAAKAAVGARFNRAQNTRVRSDANMQNMINMAKYAAYMNRPNG